MHPSSPFLLFILVSLFHRGSDSLVDEYYRYCPPQPFDCGDFQGHVSYPFLVDGETEGCGLPIYTLTCQNSSPEIQIGSKTYRVIGRIDYENRLLRIVEKQFVENEYCPIPSGDNSLLESSPFRLACNVFNVTLFYNCSEAINPKLDLVEVPCLQKIQGHPAYYTRTPRSGLPATVHQQCQVRELPLLREAFLRLKSNRTSMEEAVKEGFPVNWFAGEPVNGQSQYHNCQVAV
ncbi:uncharacterized protein [Aristolochia californica]|uniref:uncharacterized protein n=1 Tax=Aristolochia californica TaxID=171875 RepID=UPI0035DEA52E